MKRFAIILLFLSITSITYSQRETENWFFGTNAGISFAGGIATPQGGGVTSSSEGCAAISDKNSGALLFYTDGISVWNSNHQLMPNGTGLAGGISTQSALIVPLPLSDSLYYVFTNGAVSDTTGLQYSIIDMSLDSGRGDVVTKNVFLRNNITEKLTATAHALHDSYWISVHGFGTDTFYTYRLMSTGIDSVTVTSATGMVHSSLNIGNAYGQMKFSSCGNRIACAIGYLDAVEVFDFDNSTGVISNPITIPMPAHVFGVEFSQYEQKLYVSTYAAATLYQFDLSSGDSAVIIASSTALSIQPDTYGLQLGADRKIYVVKSFSSWLGAIMDPDVAGPSCNYVDTALFLDTLTIGATAGLCLPNFVQSYFGNPIVCSPNGVGELTNSETSVYPNPTNTFFTTNLNENSTLNVYDIHGRLMEEYSSSGTLNFGNDLAPGLYFVRLATGDREEVVKVVKY